MLKHISKRELWEAQTALFIAILLQIFTKQVSPDLIPGSQYFVIVAEVIVAVLLSFTIHLHHSKAKSIHHGVAVILLAIISVANISALVYVSDSLINLHENASGEQLLGAGIAIFLTNIIVFGLWYWELDSPGLTRTHWSKYDQDFQFTQQVTPSEYPDWKPEFSDFLYVSITNAVSFAPADARPLTRQAKLLMAAQSFVAIFTLSLLISRAVGILK
jgi:uncharacterized membrane protein